MPLLETDFFPQRRAQDVLFTEQICMKSVWKKKKILFDFNVLKDEHAVNNITT